MPKKKSQQSKFTFAKDLLRRGLFIIMLDGQPVGCIDASALRKLKAELGNG